MHIPLWGTHIRSHTQRILRTIHTTSGIIKPKPVIHPPRLSILILPSKQHRRNHTQPLTPTKQRLGHTTRHTPPLSVNQLLRRTRKIDHQGIEHRIHLRLRPPSQVARTHIRPTAPDLASPMVSYSGTRSLSA